MLLLMVTSLVFRLISSIFFANSTTFGLESNWLYCSSSEPDLIIIPLFFLGATGFISIAIEGGLGNFNRNTACMLVAFFFQFWPSLKN